MTGWWTGVTAGDFDGDGRLDLVVGNWGLNNKYREFLADGLRVYHGDVDGNDVSEIHFDEPSGGRGEKKTSGVSGHGVSLPVAEA